MRNVAHNNVTLVNSLPEGSSLVPNAAKTRKTKSIWKHDCLSELKQMIVSYENLAATISIDNHLSEIRSRQLKIQIESK